MNTARVRIGRIRMKAGGADLRVLETAPKDGITAKIRRFARHCDRYAEPSSAFVAIAFWPSDGEPWRPCYLTDWTTRDPDLPAARLFRNASEQLAVRGAVEIAVDEARYSMGYQRPPEDKD
jgi:hypothetical protein